MDLEKIDRIIEDHKADKSELISILQDVQAEYNWLPQDVLIHIANRLGVPLIDVFSIATFYKSFSLKPRGKHLITICLGTACHVRGGHRILDKFQRNLSIAPGKTTEDKQFTLEIVRCLGCCALGPVVVVDDEYYGQMNTKKVDTIIQKYIAREGNA